MGQMGQIVYKPHCDNCGALIDDEISYTEIEESNAPILYKSTHIHIYPEKCKVCGVYFDAITIALPEKKEE